MLMSCMLNNLKELAELFLENCFALNCIKAVEILCGLGEHCADLRTVRCKSTFCDRKIFLKQNTKGTLR